MQSVTLATGQFTEQFRNEFKKEYYNLIKSGIPITLNEKNNGGLLLLDFNFSESEVSEETVREYFAQKICNFIFAYWEKKLLQAIISHDYGQLNSQERDYIYSKALIRLQEMDKIYANVQLPTRKKEMWQKLLSFLQDNTYINIDGFIQFRNKEYLEELRKIIDAAAEEYYIDQEYYEFINLLKSLIEWQEPKVEYVHVVFLPSGGFQLFDNYDKVIDKNYLDGFLLDFEKGIINYDDLLISSLINISPRNIILHTLKQNNFSEMLKIIYQVFEKRVVTCEGCERCNVLQQKN